MSNTEHSPLDPVAKLRHDLRTPVNQILGYSEMLQEDAEAAGHASYVADLRKIQNAARELERLIKQRLGITIPSEAAGIAQAPAFSGEKPSSQLPKLKLYGRVIVADDDAGNLDMLTLQLERFGLEVDTAANGREVLGMLAGSSYDLALLDVMMPEMDGYSALLQIKSHPATHHLPVIMISALDELESVIRCIEAGAEDYLPKPFNPTLLRARISASLEKKALNDAEQKYLQTIEETRGRLERELAEAANYVRATIPPPLSEPFTIDWSYIPSGQLGGDAFGYHWIDAEHFAIYLLDVCGHGVAASLLAVTAINVIRSAALPDTDFRNPSAVLSALNKAFPMEQQNNMYFTLWYGVYHVPSRTLRHACAGHPPALLLQDGSIQRLHSLGMIIGVMEGGDFPSQDCVISPGASLLVFCDGCYEIGAGHGAHLAFDDFEVFMQQNGQRPEGLEELLKWLRGRQGADQLLDDFSILRIQF